MTSDVALDMAGYHSLPTQSRWHSHQHISPIDPWHTKDHDLLDNTSTPLHTPAYSWEWGAFPQPSPIHFATPFIAKALNTAHDEPDENERILMRSRSVPPELEASPHVAHTSLPALDGDHDHDNYPPCERQPPTRSDTDTSDLPKRSGPELPVPPSGSQPPVAGLDGGIEVEIYPLMWSITANIVEEPVK